MLKYVTIRRCQSTICAHTLSTEIMMGEEPVFGSGDKNRNTRETRRSNHRGTARAVLASRSTAEIAPIALAEIAVRRSRVMRGHASGSGRSSCWR